MNHSWFFFCLELVIYYFPFIKSHVHLFLTLAVVTKARSQQSSLHMLLGRIIKSFNINFGQFQTSNRFRSAPFSTIRLDLFPFPILQNNIFKYFLGWQFRPVNDTNLTIILSWIVKKCKNKRERDKSFEHLLRENIKNMVQVGNKI